MSKGYSPKIPAVLPRWVSLRWRQGQERHPTAHNISLHFTVCSSIFLMKFSVLVICIGRHISRSKLCFHLELRMFFEGDLSLTISLGKAILNIYLNTYYEPGSVLRLFYLIFKTGTVTEHIYRWRNLGNKSVNKLFACWQAALVQPFQPLCGMHL